MRNILIIARRDSSRPVRLAARLRRPRRHDAAPRLAVLHRPAHERERRVRGRLLAGRPRDDGPDVHVPAGPSGLFVIPAVTMRSLAEEKRTGTLELLITMPVQDSEVILGKYLAALRDGASSSSRRRCSTRSRCSCGPGTSARSTGVRSGPATSAACSSPAPPVGVGLMFSSLTESQVIAFFMTAGHASPFSTRSAGSPRCVHGSVRRRRWTSSRFQARFEPFARGLIDTRASSTSSR